MAILEVTNTDVLQRCERCENERWIPLAGLQAGVALDPVSGSDPTIIPLPPCPNCSSFECLIREPDDEPAHPSPGSFGHLHRLLVNHLHSVLVSANKVHPFLKDKNGKANSRLAKPVDKANLDKFFGGGLKIDRAVAGAGRSPPAPGPGKGSGPVNDPGPTPDTA